jgi:hypothetical protein
MLRLGERTGQDLEVGIFLLPVLDGLTGHYCNDDFRCLLLLRKVATISDLARSKYLTYPRLELRPKPLLISGTMSRPIAIPMA